jgi:hypothetical protein
MNSHKSDPARCACTGLFGSYHMSQCSNKAKFKEDGKGWCGIHLPSKLKAKDDAREARWKAEDKARDARYAVDRAKEAVVLAAEAYVAVADAGGLDDGQLREAVRLLGECEAKAKELGLAIV